MKDILPLESTSASSNASARLYAQTMVPVPHGRAGQRSVGPQDRVSVSLAAQNLNDRAAVEREGASAQRLAALKESVLSDTLEIDFNAIADHLLDGTSRE